MAPHFSAVAFHGTCGNLEEMKLLFYGDVVGKLGRAGVKLTLPEWKKEYAPDVVIANVENVAHGLGIGEKQIAELREAGVDIFTGGNHSIEGKNAGIVLADETISITRPANMDPDLPGKGIVLFKKDPMTQPLLVINLIGQANMKQSYDSPFHAVDGILDEYKNTTPFIVVDWHADVTSEKTIMGRYLDGRVSGVFGTHTHVPTADAKILPQGTAYISDIGMVGPADSIIGVDIAASIIRFKKQIRAPMNVVEEGPIEVGAIFVEIGDNGHAVDIRQLRKILINYTIQ